MIVTARKNKIFFSIIFTVLTLWFGYMMMNEKFALFIDSWFMSVTMIFGSFIAGASSEGGGAIAFPVMTLMFNIAPKTARDFALMIQSFGMIAASLSIFIYKIKVLKNVIGYALIGSTIGLLIGFTFFQGVLSPPLLKLFFTSLWLSFALTLYKTSFTKLTKDSLEISDKKTALSLITLSILGGIITSLTGTGVDIILFSYLTLRKEVCLKVATPTSVIIMGITSVIGFIFNYFFYTKIPQEAFNYLLVCIPVVIIGAPLGAIFLSKRGKEFVRKLLIAIILVQYIGSIFVLEMSLSLFLFSGTVILLGFALFQKINIKKIE